MAKTYIKLWESYESYFEPLGAAEVGRLVLAMMQYKSSGVAPEFSGSEKFIWPAIKRDLDEDIAYTERQAEQEKESKRKSRQVKASQGKLEQAEASQGKPIRNKEIGRRNKDVGERRSLSRPAALKGSAVAPPTLDELARRFENRELAEAVSDWIVYKQEQKKAYKPTGLKSLLTQIENQATRNGVQPVVDAIRLSMSNGWQGIVWDRLRPEKTTTNNPFWEMLREEEARESN